MDIEQRISRIRFGHWFHDYFPLVVAVGWVLLFFTTFRDLWSRWTLWDSEMAHGIPTMLVFFYLLWRSAPWATSPSPVSLVSTVITPLFLGALTVLWAVAYAVNIQIVEQLALMAILPVFLAGVYGWPLIIRHRFLFLFPVFAVPIWGSFNNILLDAASLVVGEMVRLVEIPAVIRGNSIHIPYGQILIADGCSGIRYFVIALTLAYLIGYLNNYREGRMAVLLLIGAILGLVTNWIRIFILILIGYHTEMQSSLMQDHELFGWILFSAICLPAVYFAPVVKNRKPAGATARLCLPAAKRIGLVAGVAAGPLLALYMSVSLLSPDDGAYPGVTGAGEPLAMPMPVRAPAGSRVRNFHSGGVYVRIDHYQRTSMDDKLVPYIPRLFDHQYWQRTSNEADSIAGINLRLSELAGVSERRRVVQAQWFRLGGNTTASVAHAKLLQVPAVFLGVNDFFIYTLQVECERHSCESAKRRIEQSLAEGSVSEFLRE